MKIKYLLFTGFLLLTGCSSKQNAQKNYFLMSDFVELVDYFRTEKSYKLRVHYVPYYIDAMSGETIYFYPNEFDHSRYGLYPADEEIIVAQKQEIRGEVNSAERNPIVYSYVENNGNVFSIFGLNNEKTEFKNIWKSDFPLGLKFISSEKLDVSAFEYEYLNYEENILSINFNNDPGYKFLTDLLGISKIGSSFLNCLDDMEKYNFGQRNYYSNINLKMSCHDDAAELQFKMVNPVKSANAQYFYISYRFTKS